MLHSQTKFENIYGREPLGVAFCPYRVCPLGAHSDHQLGKVTGMAINAETRRPKIANLTGGLSGPAVKPVALRMVYEASKAVTIPVIGMGGICTGIDAVEFMLAGAKAVAVGQDIFTSSAVIPSRSSSMRRATSQ